MVSERLREVLPHYVAMLLIVWVVLGGIRILVDRPAIWVELVIIGALCFVYIVAVRRLGKAPSAWE